jgi:DNA-3-methyladenine glycosylase II
LSTEQQAAPVSQPRTLDPARVDAGIAHLRAADPAMARAIDAVGPFKLTLEEDYFFALVDAIVSQQISIKAAASILARVRALCAPDPVLTPAHLADLPEEALRAVGCSRAKALYLQDLSARIVAGTLDLAQIGTLPDEEIVSALVAVKGIGRWTAEMFLIFSLGRLDVWPVDDLGIVIAAQGLYDLPARPKRKELLALGEPLRPYRTIAAWYLWQSRRLLLGMPW